MQRALEHLAAEQLDEQQRGGEEDDEAQQEEVEDLRELGGGVARVGSLAVGQEQRTKQGEADLLLRQNDDLPPPQRPPAGPVSDHGALSDPPIR